MRTLLICLFCVLFQILSINCDGIIVEQPDPNRKHNGYCYATWGDLGEMSKNEIQPVPGMCYQAKCHVDHTVFYYTCPYVVGQEGCRFVDGDPSKPYPDCCGREECPID